MSKISLNSQISAVQAFIDGRAAGMTVAQRALHRSHMTGVLETLKWLRANEAAIKDAINRGNHDKQ